MSRALVILDGAAEPIGDRPTALELARTPALDALVRAGTLGRLRTTPNGLAPGSETGLPTLLGAPPAVPVGRGRVEAAAVGASVPEGSGAWRIDVHRLDGRRATGEEARTLAAMLRMQLCRHRITPLRGHRLLARGMRAPKLDGKIDGFRLTVWPDGSMLSPTLDDDTAVVCAPGAMAGCARLIGARVVVPAGATGDVDSDLAGKARAAAALVAEGIPTVVVHVGAPDEAAHRLDADGKRRAIEAADAHVVAPLLALLGAGLRELAVAIDHGTSPRTGEHDAAPTPWAAASSARAAGPPRGTPGAPAAAGSPLRAPGAPADPPSPHHPSSADERPTCGRSSALDRITEPGAAARPDPLERLTERAAARHPVRTSPWLHATVNA